MNADSITLREIGQIPAVVRDGAEAQRDAAKRLATLLAGRKPRLLATVGRGSSDHVATYLRYAFELMLGVPGASLSPSIASLYGRQLDLDETLCLAVSQSGRSPDIVSTARMARRGGAVVVAIVNDVASPLAEAADVVVPIGAGPETAVAATKSFIGAAAAGMWLLAELAGETGLARALAQLPHMLERSAAVPVDLSGVLASRTAFVLGRGPALGIAQEAALKMKEIAQFPAEAFSSAEVRHGPWQLGQIDCALVGWRTDEKAAVGQREALEAYREFGRTVVDLQAFGGTNPSDVDGLLAPLLPLPGFYHSLVQAALAKGLDVDAPALLRKVTETV